MTKIELRKLALTKRNALTPKQIGDWSALITSQIIHSTEFQQAKLIHIYKSFGSEVLTQAIITKAFKTNKTVIVPEVGNSNDLKHWQVFPETVYNEDRFGMSIPIRNRVAFEVSSLESSDLIIIPVVAFDLHNNRIGYGKGFYDKFLSQINCKKIGLAFKSQLVNDFEPDDWDIPLDQIVHN